MPGRFLAEFELHVMLAVAQLGNGACGASVRREIEVRTGRDVAVGALYSTLSRLGEKGLLEFELARPAPVRGGRATKQYRLTPAGREAVAHSSAMLRRMMDGVKLVASGDSGLEKA